MFYRAFNYSQRCHCKGMATKKSKNISKRSVPSSLCQFTGYHNRKHNNSKDTESTVVIVVSINMLPGSNSFRVQ